MAVEVQEGGKVKGTRKRRPADAEARQRIAMMKERIRELRKMRPGLFLVPNVGQSRLLEHFRKAPFPKDAIFMGGNGAGKTVFGAKITGAMIWGPSAAVSSGILSLIHI